MYSFHECKTQSVHGHAGLIASVGFPWVREALEALVPCQPARLKGKKPEIDKHLHRFYIYIDVRDPKGIPASKTSKFEVSGELGEFSKVVCGLHLLVINAANQLVINAAKQLLIAFQLRCREILSHFADFI